MEKAPKKPAPRSAIPPLPPAKQGKRITNGVKPSARSKPTVSNSENTVKHASKPEGNSKPKATARRPLPSKKPTVAAVDVQTTTLKDLKRKNEETLEKKAKKAKVEEKTLEPRSSEEDREDNADNEDDDDGDDNKDDNEEDDVEDDEEEYHCHRRTEICKKCGARLCCSGKFDDGICDDCHYYHPGTLKALSPIRSKHPSTNTSRFPRLIPIRGAVGTKVKNEEAGCWTRDVSGLSGNEVVNHYMELSLAGCLGLLRRFEDFDGVHGEELHRMIVNWKGKTADTSPQIYWHIPPHSNN
ncbi:hypothetical protein B0T20DRAFT_390667 [Sordaria brevicollis]|uniref:Uncharacterized protein n=1 Tax=Sordaria brevicollis TaxID=83679 RepID=A0AAE0PJS8_SORBR|nr:hypothetical protein B0T20DRAFT_390667 [Sordaria brevicollis]